MPPSSPLDDWSYSQQSTVVRKAPVTPFCCFLILRVKRHIIQSQSKVTTKRPLIFISGSPEVNLCAAIKKKGEKKEKEKRKIWNPNLLFFPPLSVQKLKCTTISAEASERKRDRALQKSASRSSLIAWSR